MKTVLILLAVSTLTVTASDDLQVFTDYSDFNYEDVQVELSGPVLANDRCNHCTVDIEGLQCNIHPRVCPGRVCVRSRPS